MHFSMAKKNVLTVVVPVLINKDMVEPSYNYLKFRVLSHNYICTNLIVDCYYTLIYFFKHKVFWFFNNVYNSSFENCFWKVISEPSHRLFPLYAFVSLCICHVCLFPFTSTNFIFKLDSFDNILQQFWVLNTRIPLGLLVCFVSVQWFGWIILVMSVSSIVWILPFSDWHYNLCLAAGG